MALAAPPPQPKSKPNRVILMALLPGKVTAEPIAVARRVGPWLVSHC